MKGIVLYPTLSVLAAYIGWYLLGGRGFTLDIAVLLIGLWLFQAYVAWKKKNGGDNHPKDTK